MQVAQTPPQLRIVLSLFSAREESSHARVHVSSFTAGGELNNVLRSCNERLFVLWQEKLVKQESM